MALRGRRHSVRDVRPLPESDRRGCGSPGDGVRMRLEPFRRGILTTNRKCPQHVGLVSLVLLLPRHVEKTRVHFVEQSDPESS
jgi:hypothetical protein